MIRGLAKARSATTVRPGIVILLLSTVLSAQSAQPQAPQGGRPGVVATPSSAATATRNQTAGIIRGRVRSADTGAPLARAYVTLSATGVRDQRSATTDARGVYEFRNLAAGRYFVSVSRTGYVTTPFGQRRGEAVRSTAIEIVNAQVVESIDVSLVRGGAIEGRVVDQRGEPLVEATVFVARSSMINGERRFDGTYTASTATDDRGFFRLYGLDAGSKYLAVNASTLLGNNNQPITFYPGTVLPSEAQPLVMTAGQEIAGITLQVIPVRLSTISGTVTDSTSRPAPDSSISADAGAPVRGGRTLKDGSFSIANVPPGRYELNVQTATREYVSVPVVVADTDVVVSLVTAPSWPVRGRIVFEEGRAPAGVAFDTVAVNLQSRYEGGVSSLKMWTGPKVSSDWTFETPTALGAGAITASSRTPRPPGGRDPWMFKGVFRRGVDVTDTLIDFTSAVDDLEVVLTTRVTLLTGTVVDRKGVPSRDVAVVIFADDPEKWRSPSRFVRVVRTTQTGQFSASSLPPGKYRAIALDDIEQGAEADASFLERLRSSSTALTIGEGETKTVNLRVVAP
jgi:hypothetical protein